MILLLMSNYSEFPLIVVGSGFTGMTVAWNFAELTNKKVLIIEKRSHIGGNSYSYRDSRTGIEVHKYGSHLFHTSNEKVKKFICMFSSFNDYKHQVKTIHNGKVFSFPINLLTLSEFFGRSFSPAEAKVLLDSKKIRINSPKNFEDKALGDLGVELYEAFFKGYTQKQWQVDPKLLPVEVFGRIPIRFNYNDRYFNDDFEGTPVDGYGKIFDKMATHPKIEIITDKDYFNLGIKFNSNQILFYTGPIDTFFGKQYGNLTWRTLDFEWETLSIEDFQGTSVMNYADLATPWTRIHEFKHLTPNHEFPNGTIIAKEFSRLSQISDEPFYPVNTTQDRIILNKYRELASSQKNVLFGGRLGRYQYLDMHMAIASGLKFSEELAVNFQS
jgi:UDP-galactopyranose mutase